MTKPIPAGVWLIVGVIVTVVSLFLPDIRYFMVIGLIFLLFGIIKVVARQKKKRHDPSIDHTYHTQQAPDYTKGKQHMQYEQAHHPGKKCYICGMRSPMSANYCARCGHRV